MDEKELPTFMKPARFAKLIDYQRSKVYDMLLRGELRGVKIGGAWRIPADELERFKTEAATRTD
jgi:excisionase family DNA binding protein